MAPSLNRMRLPIAPYLHMVRRAGLEPAHPSASVFETDSYTNSGICAFQWYTARDSNPHARSWTPVPETGVSTNSTSRAYWYAERDSNSHACMGAGPSDRGVYHSTICAYGLAFGLQQSCNPVASWRSESDLNAQGHLLPRLLSREVSYQLEYHSM